jgi:F-type H+-transporting ATPase subunit delta
MQDAIVARKYATALFDAARSKDVLDRVAEDLRGVLALEKQGAGLGRFLEAPHITTESKRAVLDKALKSQLSELTLRLLHLLIEKKRVDQLSGICERFEELLRDHRGIVAARVRTAEPLEPAQVERLAGTLGRLIGKTVEVESRVDPDVLGGVVLEFGTMIVDRSVRRGLDDLRDRLMKARVL